MQESSPELSWPLHLPEHMCLDCTHTHLHKNPRADVGTCIKAPSVFLDWPSQNMFCKDMVCIYVYLIII